MSSQTIHNAIVHNLVKAQGTRTVDTELRATPLAVTATLQRLIDAVHEAYANRAGKSYGAFEPDAVVHPAQTYIRTFLNGDGQDPEHFISVTHSLMSILADRAAKESFSLGGYVLMADLSNGATRWFLMAVLTDVTGAAINADLEVVDATHLDLSAMRFAGRINLTDWQGGVDRYISFLRGKKADVAGYFQNFIGVSTLIKPVQETQRLVQLVKQFALDQGLDDQRRERLLEEVHHFGIDCSKHKRELDLNALANRVWPENPEVLQTAFARADPPLADGFVPDGRTLGSLRKFKAKTASWALEFDRSAMSDHTIQFDAAARTLTISHIPDDIADRLNAEFAPDTDTP